MRIAVDVRPLQEGCGGVAEYTRNITMALLRNDNENEYVLFQNSFRNAASLEGIPYQKALIADFHYPSKMLNGSIKTLRWPHLDRMIELKIGKSIDLFFAPNCDFFSFRKNIKKIVTMHDLSFEIYPWFLSRRSKRWHGLVNPQGIASSFDHIIAVSEHTRYTIQKMYNINSRRITAIPLGVDGTLFAVKDEPRASSSKYFLCWGSNEKRKNIPHLIHSFARATRKSPALQGISLIIAGKCSSSEQARLRSMIRAHSLEKQCVLTGIVSDEARRRLYAGALCVAYPSFYEGFGLPGVEAFASGIPVIASRVSAMPEILSDAALLVDPYDENELSQAIIEMCSDARLRNWYAEQGKRIAGTYSWDYAASKTLVVFKSVSQ